MRAFVYPEKTYEELGAERWQVEWYRASASYLKRKAADPETEFDHDSDVVCCAEYCATKDQAMDVAKRILDSGVTFFGQVIVMRQVVDWYVEEDRVAEWADAGEPEYVD